MNSRKDGWMSWMGVDRTRFDRNKLWTSSLLLWKIDEDDRNGRCEFERHVLAVWLQVES